MYYCVYKNSKIKSILLYFFFPLVVKVNKPCSRIFYLTLFSGSFFTFPYSRKSSNITGNFRKVKLWVLSKINKKCSELEIKPGTFLQEKKSLLKLETNKMPQNKIAKVLSKSFFQGSLSKAAEAASVLEMRHQLTRQGRREVWKLGGSSNVVGIIYPTPPLG